jgi:type I thyroxine 5'-deiodinase
VYIQEAHPDDGWQVLMNLEQQIRYPQPKTIEERTDVAQACVLRLNFKMPMLLDEMSNQVDLAYAALPERLYVISRDGRIGWRSGPGPWGFDVEGWERAIRAEVSAR